MLKKVKKHHDFMWDYLKDLGLSLSRPAIVFLMGLSLTIILIGATAIYWAEHPNNPQFGNFLDAVYFAVTVVTTVGLGDIHPISRAGKVLSMIFMLMGTGLFVSFTAVLSASIMQIETNKKNENHPDA